MNILIEQVVNVAYFRTYDDCEFEPGAKLNVILGPNGRNF